MTEVSPSRDLRLESGTEERPKKRIAILGGGMGGLAAAYALTGVDGWKDAYEVTVYQLGWRLGGKGASGRNAKKCNRIEEHGLHVWAGFYENAFRVMGACYKELNRPTSQPLSSLFDGPNPAFHPVHSVRLEDDSEGRWEPWNLTFLPKPGMPGDERPRRPFGQLTTEALEWLFDKVASSKHLWAGPVARDTGNALGPFRLLQWLVLRLWFGSLRLLWRTLGLPDERQLLARIEVVMKEAPDGDMSKVPWRDRKKLVRLLKRYARQMLWLLAPRALVDTAARRLLIVINLAITQIKGILSEDLLTRGFESIDHHEWSSWCRKHGAYRMTLASPLAKGLYEYVFSFEHGNVSRPALAAGTAVKGQLLLYFGYKGAFQWKMNSGMGDAAFVPLYQVLERRGVKFEFFHKVESLILSEDKKRIERIQIAPQVELKVEKYEPLVTVNGLECWPSWPRTEQIVNGDQLADLESPWSQWSNLPPLFLEAGKHFDAAILGISIGAFPDVCGELIRANPAWANMVTHVQSVATLSLQLWIDGKCELEWPPGTTMTGYEQRLATWADMRHVAKRECWPMGEEPNILYGTGPLQDPPKIPDYSDHQYPSRQRRQVQSHARWWLARAAGYLWPGVCHPIDPRGLDWRTLIDPENHSESERLGWQHYRANVNPSDRYVQALPGSTEFRLSVDQSGFENLYLAGDWVRSELNAGCVESATETGLAAGRAVAARMSISAPHRSRKRSRT